MILVLGGIATVSAFLVALVNNLTQDAIAHSNEQAKNEAKFNVLGVSTEEATVARDTTFTIGSFNVTASTVVSNSDNSIIGYAIEAPSLGRPGYSGDITLMVGFKESVDAVTITGVEVLSQAETPGLGANMTKPGNSLEQSIINRNPEELVFMVTKDNANGSFVPLTGSTISSRAYTRAVETAYAGYLAATNRLDTSTEAMEAAPSGATSTESDEVAASGATTIEECAAEENNQTEPAAQEGEISNE